MLFDEDFPLELDPVAQFHELMRVAGIAVLAGKFASAIRIDGPGKRQIALAHHPIKQRSRTEREVLDVVPFAQRLTRSRQTRDANQLRRRLGIGEQGK